MDPNIRNRFLAALSEQIDSQSLFSPGDRWLLAVSGGPDSMAMLHGLLALQRETDWPGPNYFHVAHLNHQLRGAESDADVEFVRDETKKLGLDCTIGSVNITEAAKDAGESIETTSRSERYQFLGRTAIQNQCNKIILAHNADDQAETVLHRIIRGTGVRGLAGIPAKRKMAGEDLWLARPLLNIRRSLIEAYLEEKGIAFCQDHTNLETEYTRNRIRHDLIPQLARQYNPKIIEVLLQLAQTADWLGETIRSDAENSLAEMMISAEEGVITLDAGKLSTPSRQEQAEIIHQILGQLKVPLRNMGFKQIRSVLELIHSDGGTVQLPGGLTVHKEVETIAFQFKAEQNHTVECPDLGRVILKLPGVTVPAPGRVRLDGGQVKPIEQIEAQWFEGSLEDLETFRSRKTPAQEMMDLDKIQGKLILRQRQSGDRFTPLGVAGEKTLGDFFTDAKVPVEYRKRIGLVCDEAGIVWVIGMRIAERVKITAGTREILKLTVEER